MDVQYLKKLQELHNDIPFFPERMKIEKAKKIVDNLHDKTEYIIHIRKLKQPLNHWLEKLWKNYGKFEKTSRY